MPDEVVYPKFQSTLLQEERPFLQMPLLLFLLFQSTLLQEERRNVYTISPNCSWLSIHVPTRGATIFKFRFRIVFLLSIHAPTRGATGGYHWSGLQYVAFNPRSYKRSDKVLCSLENAVVLSIHAPTRGATLVCVLI